MSLRPYLVEVWRRRICAQGPLLIIPEMAARTSQAHFLFGHASWRFGDNAVLSAAEASGKQPLPQKAPPQYERRSPPRGVFPGLTFFSQALEAQAGSSRVA